MNHVPGSSEPLTETQQIVSEVRALHRRIDTLNTRLFGNPEGDADGEGRLAPRKGFVECV